MKKIIILCGMYFFSFVNSMEEQIIEKSIAQFPQKPSCDIVMLLLQKSVMYNTRIMNCDKDRCSVQGFLESLNEKQAQEICGSNYTFIKHSNILAIGVTNENDFYKKGMPTCMRNRKI